jgi:effector-binding domain-containing protein
MELKVDIGFDKLLELIGQLSDEEKIKLLDEVEKTISQPGKDTRNRGGFGIWKGKVWMADDFDEPLDDFKEYM